MLRWAGQAVETEFRARGRELEERGEQQCTAMVRLACTGAVEDTESEEFCEEFLFFTEELDKKKRL